MDRWVTPPKRVTSPNWGPPPPCKQAPKLYFFKPKLYLQMFTKIGVANHYKLRQLYAYAHDSWILCSVSRVH